MEDVLYMRRKRKNTNQPEEHCISISVSFHPDVVQYVDAIADADERSRSYVIDRIIREHMAQEDGVFHEFRPQTELTAQAVT